MKRGLHSQPWTDMNILGRLLTDSLASSLILELGYLGRNRLTMVATLAKWAREMYWHDIKSAGLTASLRLVWAPIVPERENTSSPPIRHPDVSPAPYRRL